MADSEQDIGNHLPNKSSLPKKLGGVVAQDFQDSLDFNHEHDKFPWDGLAPERGLWAKKYLEDGLTIACNVQLCGGPGDIHFPLSVKGHGETSKNILVVVNSVNCDGNGLCIRDNQPMLINSVEFVEGPEGIIPSFVRFYRIQDEVGSALGNRFYRSQFTGDFEAFPIPLKREINIIESGLTCATSNSDLIGGNIESRAKIVDSVAEYQGNVFWDRLSNLQTEGIQTGLRVLLGNDFMCIGFGPRFKERFKVLDVLLGPIDFEL